MYDVKGMRIIELTFAKNKAATLIWLWLRGLVLEEIYGESKHINKSTFLAKTASFRLLPFALKHSTLN